jgi:hypothetical protein
MAGIAQQISGQALNATAIPRQNILYLGAIDC